MKVTVLILLGLTLSCSAEDLLLSNGRLYKDIEVVSADDQAVLIRYGPYHSGVKIPWSWLSPEQRTKLEPVGKKKAEDSAIQQKITDSGRPFRLKIRQSTGEIVIADYQLGTVVVGRGPSYVEYSPTASEPIAVSGLDELVDGDAWEGILYPTGIYRYTTVSGATKSVRSFTASAQKALEVLQKDK